MPTVTHINHVYSHEPTHQRERERRGFNSPTQAQRFLALHGLTKNLFRLIRHLVQAVNYRLLRTQAFQVWQEAMCALDVVDVCDGRHDCAVSAYGQTTHPALRYLKYSSFAMGMN